VRHLQKEEMTGHREVAPNVFETRYGDGSRTVVNYRPMAFLADGVSVLALGYTLVNPDGSCRRFAFDADKGLADTVSEALFKIVSGAGLW
jgi:hypothetical protein